MAIAIKRPYGISLPIQRGPTGYFAQTYDRISQTKFNLMTFLRTRKGERRMMPTYGSGLYQALFEFSGMPLEPILEDIIKNDIATWMPEINILNVTIDTSDVNNFVASISVMYNVNGIGSTIPQSITIPVNQSIA
jgi:phage baseplate assembly protein W